MTRKKGDLFYSCLSFLLATLKKIIRESGSSEAKYIGMMGGSRLLHSTVDESCSMSRRNTAAKSFNFL